MKSCYCFGRLRPLSGNGPVYCLPHRDIPVEAEKDLNKYIRANCRCMGYIRSVGHNVYWHKVQDRLYYAEICVRY